MKPKKGPRVSVTAVCTVMILSAVLFMTTPKVSAQGSWTETTYDDFIDSEELSSVVVNGTGSAGYVELDITKGFKWVNMSTSGAPPSRDYFAMAYDDYNQVAVMFGGFLFERNPNPPPFGKEIFFDDTWEYDYSTNTWTNITNPSSKPTPRFSHKMAYDSFNQVIVLFGGLNKNFNALDDTWEFNVITKEWNSVATSPKPSARSDYAMTYDSANKKVMLFGGMKGGFPPTPLDDTWAYDANSNTWTQMSTPARPGGRLLHDMAYDSANNIVVLYGGDNPVSMIQYDDTWEYSYPSNWTETTGGDSPGYRTLHSMAFHKGLNWTILFGGLSGSGSPNDTWAFYHALGRDVWIQMFTETSPREGIGYDMVYDTANDVLILFGGTDGISNINETWALEMIDVYVSGGYMISSPCDSGESPPKPEWQFIYWNPETQPPNTFLRIQLANSTDGLNWSEFVGPDGSTDSYYTNGAGEYVFPGHSGLQYLKYQAIFRTRDNTVSPRLDDIKIIWDMPLGRPANLKVERDFLNGDIILDWNPTVGATEYHIYESQDRFASWPWALLGTVSLPETQFTHEGALSNGTTHYYIVRGSNGTAEGGNSTMGAKTHLTFSPPTDPKLTDINWLSLPYNSIYKKASDIANELTEAKIRTVGKWDPAKQKAITYSYAKGKWRGVDFDINPGEGVFIAGLQQDFDWVVTGTDSALTLGFSYYPKHKKNINWISVPYTGIYNNATSIVMDIEGGLIGPPTKIIEVGKWNATIQTVERFYWDGAAWTGTDFTVEPGDGIYIQIITSFGWPIKLLTPTVP